MNGKTVILIIIVVTLVALLLTWLWMQNVIEDYDVDRKALTDMVKYFI